MSCCSTTPAPTRAEFLDQKLKNFRAFVAPHCATPAAQDHLKTYSSIEAAMPLLLKAVAAERLGQSDALVDKFCESLTIDAKDLPAFREKAKRYLAMFCEVLTI